jgi:hypothetical protein
VIDDGSDPTRGDSFLKFGDLEIGLSSTGLGSLVAGTAFRVMLPELVNGS